MKRFVHALSVLALALSVSVAWAGGGGFGGGGGGRGGGGRGGGGFGGGGGGGFGGAGGGGYGGAGGGGYGGAGGGGPGGAYAGNANNNLRTNRTLTTLQSALSSPDDEWAVLAPKVQRVTDAMTQVNLTSMNTVNNRGGYAGAAANNAVATTLADLNNTLADPTQGDEVVRAKLSAYRTAVQAAKSALTLAREDLRQYVTLRQEAILIGLGYLD